VRRSLGAVAFALLCAASPLAAADADSKAAVAAASDEATHWLDGLDAHHYAESWNDAAAVMKQGRTQDDWVRDIGGPRELLGKSVMRELQHADFSTTVRGAPEGQYVTIAYLTQFSNAPPAIETVLVMLEDGRWRIAGYNLTRAPEPGAPQAPAKTDAPQPKTKG
jgi:Protein of unknown function (DUF4019)